MRHPRFALPVRVPGILLTATLTGAVLSACAPAVDVTAAGDAANPACAPMMVALPDAIGDAALRKTNSQATAAWGDPSQVILRCGVNVPGPTTDRCVSVNGIDWVIKEGNPVWTLTTFGREPATEILLDPDKISSATVLADLSAAAAKVPASRNCVGQEELQNLPSSK
ncbi:MAG TPA: DUF3515 domain-containing protein [Arthrobacter bacterium]|jgi:hypothetical protein|nr:DUF3515 domain-containing protein [Arthrobacter sp.]HBH59323.1 DUF3515 domain-containing protein [Arthrobacter sp.]HCB59386.1 DUF3515 domain-containing protein [Arthrobacter sp.]HCC39847.1 DUF3515 domain-containing protein [Arthrobacter sp.]HCN21003.1 DUF3515 domain-containing protein [Arthrobacter sp.]